MEEPKRKGLIVPYWFSSFSFKVSVFMWVKTPSFLWQTRVQFFGHARAPHITPVHKSLTKTLRTFAYSNVSRSERVSAKHHKHKCLYNESLCGEAKILCELHVHFYCENRVLKQMWFSIIQNC